MKTFLYPSRRDPSVIYHTYLHDSGAITCDCPARVECWHIRDVRNKPVGRQLMPPVSMEDQRQIFNLLNEGNTVGARLLVMNLFPSMCVEESEELLNEICATLDTETIEELEEYCED